MKNMIFACEWARNKETSWSGTNMAVRTRLEKDFNVIDFDYGIRKPYGFMAKVMQKAFHKNIDVTSHYSKVFAKKYKGNNVIFQFGEMPDAYDPSNKHFLYQDLSWANVKRMMDNESDIFKVSNYERYDSNAINQFSDRQNAFLRKDNVYCLTMGQWLTKFFVEELHLPKERVCVVGGVAI